jgi:hypothetical protein
METTGRTSQDLTGTTRGDRLVLEDGSVFSGSFFKKLSPGRT